MVSDISGGAKIPNLHGHVTGLKPSQLSAVERLYRRRIPVDSVITAELATTAAKLSAEIRRPIGLLITRRGTIEQVLIGAGCVPSFSSLGKFRSGFRSLRGLRLVRMHLHDAPLSQEDLTNLALLRLDLIAAVGVSDQGLPAHMYLAHLLPPNGTGQVFEVLPPVPFHAFRWECNKMVASLEEGLQQASRQLAVDEGKDMAILVSASAKSRAEQEERLEELSELASAAEITVLDKIMQRIHETHLRCVVGSGKLKEVVIRAFQRGANLLIFDQDLAPAQVRAISEVTEMRVIDRTQLILDIFARRAHTREGKVQVELALLRYLLPRLSGQGTSLSRLGGGIGSRGPGETKLETDRRRVHDRIAHLERELMTFTRHQDQRRSRRIQYDVPILSIVGYTNAGKSTLLNVLTKSDVSAENRPFDTLDTTSRRLRFPRDREMIVTDTVGFIHDLPKDLLSAFRTTLEELRDADLLLHLVDASATNVDRQIEAVNTVLDDLNLTAMPRILVFNKCDRLPPLQAQALCRRYGAIGISALDSATLHPLIACLESHLNISRTTITEPKHEPIISVTSHG